MRIAAKLHKRWINLAFAVLLLLVVSVEYAHPPVFAFVKDIERTHFASAEDLKSYLFQCPKLSNIRTYLFQHYKQQGDGSDDDIEFENWMKWPNKIAKKNDKTILVHATRQEILLNFRLEVLHLLDY